MTSLRTPFIKSNFTSGEYLMYTNDNLDRQFIGRFRRGSGGSTKFKAFLIKNFTVEEYLSLLEDMPPLKVLETKGYISPNMTKVLKAYGLPATQEGVAQMNVINRKEACA